jgi:hypothetical protein
MNESAINPYEAPNIDTPRTRGISTLEMMSYSALTVVQCGVASWLNVLWMNNPRSNIAKVLNDPWDWMVAGFAYGILFLILNLCAVKMRGYREGDLPSVDNHLKLAVLLLVLMVAAIFAIFGFAMALGSSQAAYFMWSLSGLTLLSLPWNWSRSSSTSS